MKYSDDKENKNVWDLLSSAKPITPSAGYLTSFWDKVDSRKKWHAGIIHDILGFLVQPKLVYSSAMAALMLITILSVNQYRNTLDTSALLANMGEEEWQMLKEYDVISNMGRDEGQKDAIRR